jgi:hypothetical protein
MFEVARFASNSSPGRQLRITCEILRNTPAECKAVFTIVAFSFKDWLNTA